MIMINIENLKDETTIKVIKGKNKKIVMLIRKNIPKIVSMIKKIIKIKIILKEGGKN